MAVAALVAGREVLAVCGLPVVPAADVPDVVPSLGPSVLGACVGLSGTIGEVGLVVPASWDIFGAGEPEPPDPDDASLPLVSVVGEIPAVVDDACDDGSVESLTTRAGPAGVDDASGTASVFCPQAEHSSVRAAAKAIVGRFVIYFTTFLYLYERADFVHRAHKVRRSACVYSFPETPGKASQFPPYRSADRHTHSAFCR